MPVGPAPNRTPRDSNRQRQTKRSQRLGSPATKTMDWSVTSGADRPLSAPLGAAAGWLTVALCHFVVVASDSSQRPGWPASLLAPRDIHLCASDCLWRALWRCGLMRRRRRRPLLIQSRARSTAGRRAGSANESPDELSDSARFGALCRLLPRRAHGNNSIVSGARALCASEIERRGKGKSKSCAADGCGNAKSDRATER